MLGMATKRAGRAAAENASGRAAAEAVAQTRGGYPRKSALIAAMLSLFGILVYVAFRYEFSFAVGAVVAVLHDVLMTIGWYCLCGREFNATTVAA